MQAFPVLMFLAIAVAIFLGVIASSKAAAKRRLALAAFARVRNLTFDSGHDAYLRERFPHFGCFGRGFDRYAYHLMAGAMDGRDVLCFDYHYSTRTTDSKGRTTTHHHHSSNVILAYHRVLTDLSVRSEGFFDRITGFFGFDDIDFESAEFSRPFHVKSPDRKWAYDVITQKTMELLMEAPRFRIEMRGTHLLLRRDSRFSPADYDAALRLGAGILDGIPADAAAFRS